MPVGLSEAPGIGRLLIENNFVVPNHQRDYSWTEDEIREFIEDITGALDANNAVYFVGLMVFLAPTRTLLFLTDNNDWLLQSSFSRQSKTGCFNMMIFGTTETIFSATS